jgi:hypothetical protein
VNQIPGWSGNGKRRKSTATGPQSCKMESFGASDLPIQPKRSGFFTDDFITQAPTLVRRGASHAVIPVTHHFAVTENANQAVSRVLTASEKGHAPNQGSVGLYQRLMKVANFVRGYRDSAGVKTAACTGLDDDCAASVDTGALALVRSSRSRPLRFAT